MANYIKGEKNYYPDIKPFTPDYKFLSAALDAREAKYQAGWEATNDLYSRVYSDLSHEDNQKFQQQFIEQLAPELSKISGLDLSLQRNVDAAKSVFAPFFEDQAVVKDIVWTSTYKKEMRRANQYADSADLETRELWNPVGIKNMQYRLQEFKDADRNQLIGLPLPQYVEDADLTQFAAQYLRGLGLEGKGMTAKVDNFTMKPGKDGILGTEDDVVANRWIITDSNGKLLEGDAYRRVMTDLTDDPRVQKFYDAKAYVSSMEFAEEGVNNGSVASMQDGIKMWSQSEIERIALLNSQLYSTLDDEIKQIATQTTTWSNYGKLNGLTPAEEVFVETKLSEAQQLRVNLETVLKQNEFANTEDRDDQALISKAYSLNKNYNITRDLQSAAYNYSRENIERTIRENEYILNEDKHKYRLLEIRAKAKADKALQDNKALLDQNLEILKAQLEGKGRIGFTDQQQGTGTTDYSDPRGALFALNNSNKDKLVTEVNENAIAATELDLTRQKAQMIAEMLSARYPNQKTFTVTLGGQLYENISPKKLTDLLLKNKTVADGTKTTVDDTQFEYYTDILRMFDEQKEWYGNRQGVINEYSPEFVGPDTDYSKIYNALFANDPLNPQNLGLSLKEDLFNEQVEKHHETLVDIAESNIANLREENEDLDEMINAGYPLPWEEKDGVKRFLSFEEYQKKFIELAKNGKIKNFDPSGFGASSSGDDEEDWTDEKIQFLPVPGGIPVPMIMPNAFDMKSAKGKSKAIYDYFNKQIDKVYNTVGGDSYMSMSRGYDPNMPFSDIGFTPNIKINASANPEDGTTADKIVGMALLQYNSTTTDPTSRVTITSGINNVEDLNEIDIEAGVDVDEAQNIIANKVFLSLFNENTVGNFDIAYYPNLGQNEQNETGNPMAGYYINNFDPKFRNEIKKIYKDDAEAWNAWNKVLNDGVFMLFDRSGNRDVNPNNLNNIGGVSYIEQKMNFSDDQSYTYEDNSSLAGFSPGSITFQDLGNGKIKINGYYNVYNANSTDIDKQYTRVPISAPSINKQGNQNFAVDLNNRFLKTRAAFQERDRLNNLLMYQVRAQNLSQSQFVDEYIVENPNASREQAIDMYKKSKEVKALAIDTTLD